MASAHWRSGPRGRPPPQRWVCTRLGSRGSSTPHRSSEIRKPVVVVLVGVRARVRFAAVSVVIPPSLPVIRIGTKGAAPPPVQSGPVSKTETAPVQRRFVIDHVVPNCCFTFVDQTAHFAS